MNTLNDSPLLRVSEVSKVLGMPSSSTYALIAAGDIPSHRLGPRTIRVQADDLDDYIRRTRRSS